MLNAEAFVVKNDPQNIIILGKTLDDKPFRPSDWAERLAGVMSGFRPDAIPNFCYRNYSPWCEPSHQNGVSCVTIDVALKAHNVMAWDFVINFAKDNRLQVIEKQLPDVKKPLV